jgi:hypothetical protein
VNGRSVTCLMLVLCFYRYEMSPEMLASCKKYAEWLEDSTGVSAKELVSGNS